MVIRTVLIYLGLPILMAVVSIVLALTGTIHWAGAVIVTTILCFSEYYGYKVYQERRQHMKL